jgi:hypothetical protein
VSAPRTSELARYQAALLDLFARDDLDLTARLEHLREDVAFAPYQEHVVQFDPAFVEQCVSITKRWAKRKREGKKRKR